MASLTSKEFMKSIERRGGEAAHKGWVELITSQEWNLPATVMVTVTFAIPKYSAGAVIDPLVGIGKELRFKRVLWAVEDHADRSIGKHAHGVIELVAAGDIHRHDLEGYLRGLGNSKVERIYELAGAAGYVTKTLPGGSDYYLFPRPEMWGLGNS